MYLFEIILYLPFLKLEEVSGLRTRFFDFSFSFLKGIIQNGRNVTSHVTFFNPCGESFPSFYPLHNIKSPRALIPYVAFRRFFVHQRNFCPKTFFNITPRSLCTVLNFCSSHKIPMKPKFSWCKGLIFCFANQNLVNVLTF